MLLVFTTCQASLDNNSSFTLGAISPYKELSSQIVSNPLDTTKDILLGALNPIGSGYEYGNYLKKTYKKASLDKFLNDTESYNKHYGELVGVTAPAIVGGVGGITNKLKSNVGTTIKSLDDAIDLSKYPIRDVADLGRVIEDSVVAAEKTNKLDNKLNHIFNKKEHKLDEFLNKFGNNQNQAYDATIKALEKDMANGKLPDKFTNGYKINVSGFEITVRGVIKDGKPEIGTMFIP
ncbi:MAG: hypothetical protein GX282_06265 [Campylobacteraceae bacterium]|nr:hypothetical protein [Campylobacteraceae bacterium]